MATNTKTNTIEHIKSQGRIIYDADNPISRDDLDTQLIHLLGNKSVLIEAGAKLGLVEGQKFTVNKQTFEILKVKNRLSSGFNGAVLKNITLGGKGETILWADGSKGFNNLLNSEHILKTILELGTDWALNDILGIGSDSIFQQLRDLKAFAKSYGLSKIDLGIGQSMMGIGMSALAFTEGFENIVFRTYSGCLSVDLLREIKIEWGLNKLNGANLKSYITPGEPLTNMYPPVQRNNTFYMKEYTHAVGKNAHSASAYNNLDGQESNYYRITDFIEEKFPVWQIKPRIELAPSTTGKGVELKLNISIGGTLSAVKGFSCSTGDIIKLIKELGIDANIKVDAKGRLYQVLSKIKTNKKG